MKVMVVFLSFWLVSCLSLDRGHTEYTGYSILQGPTTQNETIITVLYPKNKTLNYSIEVETKEGFKASKQIKVKKSTKNIPESAIATFLPIEEAVKLISFSICYSKLRHKRLAANLFS